MTPRELPARYDPAGVEQKWYRFWEEKKLFHGCVQPRKPMFSIVIPPPNITGNLTLGHVLDNTPQDIVVRWKRMQGFETTWIPGTDHAGIATQNVVEAQLAREGKTRHDLGREEFVRLVWQWRDRYGRAIISQLKRLGCSCDWERERFTMDEGLSAAVLEVFMRLYKKGLVYRGKRVINWCPRCRTALSDEEVDHKEITGKLFTIRYPLKGRDGFIRVATTRPETMLGDTAVAVNPRDERFTSLHGVVAILPLMGREIPIVADGFVDPEFGTGAVKVTPAHDPNDFEIATRHGLPAVRVMDDGAAMTEEAGRYRGLDRLVCREKVLADLEKEGLLEETKDHLYAVGHCYRCATVIEPALSEQWFVRMQPLAEPAIKAAEEGRIKFFPERWTKVYLDWLTNIRDWCISRQIWWGHRIPVWICGKCGRREVGRKEPEGCPGCGGKAWEQDPDVLDTWFSSWLWPFSTLGWPEETDELRYFYPTSFLNSGKDILFFWVARMVMAGLEFTGKVPFGHVYLHGIARDELGRKISKSLGNSPDPVELIEKYGADAMRFGIMLAAPVDQDITLGDATYEVGRNFTNKLWNAARFVFSNLNDAGLEAGSLEAGVGVERSRLTRDDVWILTALNRTIADVTASLEVYRFGEAAQLLYEFIWHRFCDWYIELVKPRLALSPGNEERGTAQRVLAYVLDRSIRLLHPYIPFITEELWQQLPHKGESIMVAPWPVVRKEETDETAAKEAELKYEAITAGRTLRSEWHIPWTQKVRFYIKPASKREKEVIEEDMREMVMLLRAGELLFEETQPTTKSRPVRVSSSGTTVGLELPSSFDIVAERKRLEKEIRKLDGLLEQADRKLSEERFLKGAPPAIVEKERARRTEYASRRTELARNLEQLS